MKRETHHTKKQSTKIRLFSRRSSRCPYWLFFSGTHPPFRLTIRIIVDGVLRMGHQAIQQKERDHNITAKNRSSHGCEKSFQKVGLRGYRRPFVNGHLNIFTIPPANKKAGIESRNPPCPKQETAVAESDQQT